MSHDDKTLAQLLKLAASDPGQFAGYKLDRSLSQWMGDAIDAVLETTPQGQAASVLRHGAGFECTHAIGAAAAYVASTADAVHRRKGVKAFEVKDVLYDFATGELDADEAVAQLINIGSNGP